MGEEHLIESLVLDQYYKRHSQKQVGSSDSVGLSWKGSQGLNRHLVLNLVQA